MWRAKCKVGGSRGLMVSVRLVVHPKVVGLSLVTGITGIVGGESECTAPVHPSTLNSMLHDWGRIHWQGTGPPIAPHGATAKMVAHCSWCVCALGWVKCRAHPFLPSFPPIESAKGQRVFFFYYCYYSVMSEKMGLSSINPKSWEWKTQWMKDFDKHFGENTMHHHKH